MLFIVGASFAVMKCEFLHNWFKTERLYIDLSAFIIIFTFTLIWGCLQKIGSPFSCIIVTLFSSALIFISGFLTSVTNS